MKKDDDKIVFEEYGIEFTDDDFKGVDLSMINKITLSFPKSSGSIMLREIQVV